MVDVLTRRSMTGPLFFLSARAVGDEEKARARCGIEGEEGSDRGNERSRAVDFEGALAEGRSGIWKMLAIAERSDRCCISSVIAVRGTMEAARGKDANSMKVQMKVELQLNGRLHYSSACLRKALEQPCLAPKRKSITTARDCLFFYTIM